jgi:hypothetical protein
MSAKQFGLLLGGFFAVIILVYLCIPDAGKNALRHEQAALNGVSSWRISMQISRNGALVAERTHEAVCPDKEHINERGPDADVEYVRIGDEVYYRKNSSRWTKGMPGPDLFLPLPTPRPCLSDPGQARSQPPGGAEEMRLVLQSDINNGRIEKGSVKQEKSGPCQEWTVSLYTPHNQLGSYTTCLGQSDHLPRYVQSANQNFALYFDWDVPVTVETPDTDSGK